MFEKDEDYKKVRKESKDNITKVIGVWSAREEVIHDEGFQKGAEFGYNKANEWHYVKDGDLPPEDTKVLALMANKEIYIAHFYRKNVWDKIGTVIAWKEIVLPELPKEIDK